MMKTKKLIFILTMIAILFGFNFCYAVDLNMADDLTGNIDLTTNTSNNNTNNTNTNNDNTNATTNTSTNLDSNTTTEDMNTTNTSYIMPRDNSDNSPAIVSELNATSSTGLDLSTVLNILLIVIGILLVLLSIAIIIRLKK